MAEQFLGNQKRENQNKPTVMDNRKNRPRGHGRGKSHAARGRSQEPQSSIPNSVWDMDGSQPSWADLEEDPRMRSLLTWTQDVEPPSTLAIRQQRQNPPTVAGTFQEGSGGEIREVGHAISEKRPSKGPQMERHQRRGRGGRGHQDSNRGGRGRKREPYKSAVIPSAEDGQKQAIEESRSRGRGRKSRAPDQRFVVRTAHGTAVRGDQEAPTGTDLRSAKSSWRERHDDDNWLSMRDEIGDEGGELEESFDRLRIRGQGTMRKERLNRQADIVGKAANKDAGFGERFLSRRGKNRSDSGRKPRHPRFREFLSPEEIASGLEKGELFAGELRVNPTRWSLAYVTCDSHKHDLLVEGRHHRNRAFHGDRVVVRVLPKSMWRPEKEDIALMPRNEVEAGSGLPDDIASEICTDDEAEVESEADSRSSKSESERNSETASGTEMDKGEIVDIQKKAINDTINEVFARDVQLTPFHLLRQGAQEYRKSSMMDAEAFPFVRPVCEVVGILDPSGHPHRTVGTIVPFPNAPFNAATQYCSFRPTNLRLPKMLCLMDSCPRDFLSDPKKYANVYFLGELVRWEIWRDYPFVRIHSYVGEAGAITTETEALLAENGVDSNPFNEEILDSLPSLPFVIPEEEIAKRKDLREECIFTIDPATAKDLDDALSVEEIVHEGKKAYRVGVHIADVSFFMDTDTALDAEARKRATTVYLVQKAIPMLPAVLCEDLCSLNPFVDRLAFSVIWTVDEDGKVVKGQVWAGKSVIRSCAKLDYASVQAVIETSMGMDVSEEGLASKVPENSPFPLTEIRKRILLLHSIAEKMRARRFRLGALQLGNAKFGFSLSDEQNPLDIYVLQQKEANWLVEEFMLLANMTVARIIQKAYPRAAMLRNHGPPLQRPRKQLEKVLQVYGSRYSCDISSAEAISRFLGSFSSDLVVKAVMTYLLTKPMRLATYVSSGSISSAKHFALNAEIYTHFTSPIRRYADVIVHRMLGSALAEGPQLYDDQTVSNIADRCNDKKYRARKAQDRSLTVYLCILLQGEPLVVDAIVYWINDASFDIIVTTYGMEKRIFCKGIQGLRKRKGYIFDEKKNRITLVYGDGGGEVDEEKQDGRSEKRNRRKNKKWKERKSDGSVEDEKKMDENEAELSSEKDLTQDMSDSLTVGSPREQKRVEISLWSRVRVKLVSYRKLPLQLSVEFVGLAEDSELPCTPRLETVEDRSAEALYE